MATSKYETKQYTSEEFVESGGAILLNRSTRQICLVHHKKKGEWLLAKDRCNLGESGQDAAIREVQEEIGYQCFLLPATMSTRAPPANEVGYYPDEPRVHHQATEPFMLTSRQLGSGNLNLIWWYMAGIAEDAWSGDGGVHFEATLFGFDEALAKLIYNEDRDLVQRAIDIYTRTYEDGGNSKMD
jgi:8-oxo-dGTP pyrophosphatase MutT (NUDIX family)